jgi:hypothetical protein
MKSLFSIIIFALFISACVNHNIEDLRKAPVVIAPVICDTLAISFSAKIKPLMDARCGSNDNACHTAAASKGSVFLDSYIGVKRAANSGKLISAITWDNNATRMPQGKPKLGQCDIDLVTYWVKQGKLDN